MGVVASPTTGDLHVSRPLTNFSVLYMQDQNSFIAGQAFPIQSVKKRADLYYQFNKDEWLRDEARHRADGTESASTNFSLSTEPYYIPVTALKVPVTDQQLAEQDDVISLYNSAAMFLVQKFLIRRELAFATKLFKASVWGTTSSVNWSQDSSDPMKDTRKQASIIQMNTGLRPNKYLMGRQAYDTLKDNAKVVDRIKGGATLSKPSLVTDEFLAEALGVEKIYVMDAIVTTSAPGADTVARKFVGGADALLYYAPDIVGPRQATAGTGFAWTGFLGAEASGLRMKTYREEKVEADYVEGQMAIDFKVVGSDLGHMFTSVSS